MSDAIAGWASWRRVSVAGLGTLLALLLAAALLPDPAQLTASELADLARARPITVAVARHVPAGRLLEYPGLLAIPMVLAGAIGWNVVQRIEGKRRRADRSGSLAVRFAPHREWSIAVGVERAAAAAAAWLQRRRYRIVSRHDDSGGIYLVGRRGEIGFWGSIVFHVALVVALLAFCATLALRWSGDVRLVERQHLALDDPEAVLVDRRGPLAPNLDHVVVDLARLDVTYQDDRFPLDYRAELLVLDRTAALRRATVRVNDPLEVDGTRFILKAFGIAPVVVVERDGRRLVGGPATLSVRNGREDVLEVPQTGDQLRVRWFGDLVRDGRAARSGSDLARNPALGLELVRSGVPSRTLLVKRGEVGAIGPYRISFPEVRYWIDLGVDHDPGASVLLVALVLASAGLAVRFWDHEREIRVRVTGAGTCARVAASARSRYFPAMIVRELDNMEGL